MIKTHRLSSFAFRLMALGFFFRDILQPPLRILQEAGVQSGMKILDFGCGPGSFSIAAAKLAGDTGRVSAVDISPLALDHVQKKSSRLHIGNIDFFLDKSASCLETFDQDDFDMILIYDVLHDLPRPADVLARLQRCLGPEGLLSVSDHHMSETALLTLIVHSGGYQFAGQSRRTLQFRKSGEKRGE